MTFFDLIDKHWSDVQFGFGMIVGMIVMCVFVYCGTKK